MNKMKEFSKDNQTLNQVGDNIGKGVDKIKKVLSEYKKI